MKKHSLQLLVQLFLASFFVLSCSSSDNNPEETILSDCLKIGDFHQGGIIFYIDHTNEHGLIAAMEDQNSGAIWGCPVLTESIAKQRDIGYGSMNTTAIVNNCSEDNTAAKICDVLVIDGYDDWFLPTVHELELLYYNRDLVGGFTNTNYSSATESKNNGDNYIYVFTIDFGPNPVHADRQDDILKTVPLPVRAIRKF